MRIDITFDIPCTWSYIGFTRVGRLAAEARSEGADLSFRFLPFQLDPDATAAGEPKAEVERRYFGRDFDHEVAYAELNAHGASDGARFEGNPIWANTFEAHCLLQDAAEQGHGESMAAALFLAHHVEGKNVASPAVLRVLADRLGVVRSDDGAVRTKAALIEVLASGVRAVPVISIEGGPVFRGVPAADPLREVLRGAIPA
ncbi:DsbA family protein [Nonomuraea typhae]|uniref:DsbA family protein n=1 Tax=Nonomuraea typhae TaxID=2603600 RepID=A0ABW7YW76_9ACTN